MTESEAQEETLTICPLCEGSGKVHPAVLNDSHMLDLIEKQYIHDIVTGIVGLLAGEMQYYFHAKVGCESIADQIIARMTEPVWKSTESDDGEPDGKAPRRKIIQHILQDLDEKDTRTPKEKLEGKWMIL